MKKRWWFIIIIVIVFLILILLYTSRPSISLIPSPEDFKDEGPGRIAIVAEKKCNCIGFNLGKEERYSRCLGFTFNCIEKCYAFFLRLGMEEVGIASVPCDCGEKCQMSFLE